MKAQEPARGHTLISNQEDLNLCISLIALVICNLSVYFRITAHFTIPTEDNIPNIEIFPLQ